MFYRWLVGGWVVGELIFFHMKERFEITKADCNVTDTDIRFVHTQIVHRATFNG